MEETYRKYEELVDWLETECQSTDTADLSHSFAEGLMIRLADISYRRNNEKSQQQDQPVTAKTEQETKTAFLIQTRGLTDEEWLKLPKKEILQLYKNCYKMLNQQISYSNNQVPFEKFSLLQESGTVTSSDTIIQQETNEQEQHDTCDGCQMFQDSGCMLDDQCPPCNERSSWTPRESDIDIAEMSFNAHFEDEQPERVSAEEFLMTKYRDDKWEPNFDNIREALEEFAIRVSKSLYLKGYIREQRSVKLSKQEVIKILNDGGCNRWLTDVEIESIADNLVNGFESSKTEEEIEKESSDWKQLSKMKQFASQHPIQQNIKGVSAEEKTPEDIFKDFASFNKFLYDLTQYEMAVIIAMLYEQKAYASQHPIEQEKPSEQSAEDCQYSIAEGECINVAIPCNECVGINCDYYHPINISQKHLPDVKKFSDRLDQIFEQGMPTKAQIIDAFNKFSGA